MLDVFEFIEKQCNKMGNTKIEVFIKRLITTLLDTALVAAFCWGIELFNLNLSIFSGFTAAEGLLFLILYLIWTSWNDYNKLRYTEAHDNKLDKVGIVVGLIVCFIVRILSLYVIGIIEAVVLNMLNPNLLTRSGKSIIYFSQMPDYTKHIIVVYIIIVMVVFALTRIINNYREEEAKEPKEIRKDDLKNTEEPSKRQKKHKRKRQRKRIRRKV